jgi:hypothetical protein
MQDSQGQKGLSVTGFEDSDGSVHQKKASSVIQITAQSNPYNDHIDASYI